MTKTPDWRDCWFCQLLRAGQAWLNSVVINDDVLFRALPSMTPPPVFDDVRMLFVMNGKWL